jgi:hypothetical protein
MGSEIIVLQCWIDHDGDFADWVRRYRCVQCNQRREVEERVSGQANMMNHFVVVSNHYSSQAKAQREAEERVSGQELI